MIQKVNSIFNWFLLSLCLIRISLCPIQSLIRMTELRLSLSFRWGNTRAWCSRTWRTPWLNTPLLAESWPQSCPLWLSMASPCPWTRWPRSGTVHSNSLVFILDLSEWRAPTATSARPADGTSWKKMSQIEEEISALCVSRSDAHV